MSVSVEGSVLEEWSASQTAQGASARRPVAAGGPGRRHVHTLVLGWVRLASGRGACEVDVRVSTISSAGGRASSSGSPGDDDPERPPSPRPLSTQTSSTADPKPIDVGTRTLPLSQAARGAAALARGRRQAADRPDRLEPHQECALELLPLPFRAPKAAADSFFLPAAAAGVQKPHLEAIFSAYGEISGIDLPLFRPSESSTLLSRRQLVDWLPWKLTPGPFRRVPLGGQNRGKAALEYTTAASAALARRSMHGGQLDGSVLEIVLSDLPLPALERSPSPVRRREPPRRRSRSPIGARRRSPSPPYRRGGPPPARGGWGAPQGGRRPSPSYGGPRGAGRRSPSRSRSPVRRRCVQFLLCLGNRFPALAAADSSCVMPGALRYADSRSRSRSRSFSRSPVRCRRCVSALPSPFLANAHPTDPRCFRPQSSYSRSLSQSVSRSRSRSRSFSRSRSPDRRRRSGSKRSDRSMRSDSRSPVRRR